MRELRRRFLAVLVLGMVVLPGEYFARSLMQERSMSTEEWLASHPNQARIQLNDIRYLPGRGRKRVLKALAPEQRARLWRLQVDDALTNPELTREQRAVLSDFRALTVPETYSAGTIDPATEQRALQIDRAARAAFSSERDFAFFKAALAEFSDWRVLPGRGKFWQVALPRLAAWIGGAVTVQCAPAGPGMPPQYCCNCSVTSDMCGAPTSPNECSAGACSCTPEASECGIGDLFTCNGACSAGILGGCNTLAVYPNCNNVPE